MRLVRTFLAITAAGILAAQAAPDWYSLGISDRMVNCILADDTSTIIAGTDSGVSVLWNKTWYHVKMLPVTSMVRVSSTAVAVAAGNGSKSDGVYIGKNIINGPPFYSFTLGDYFESPTALASGPAVSEQASLSLELPVVLYVGNKNSVAWGLVIKDSLSTLTTIKMSSQYPFGVEQPFCASLHIFRNRLYAGGYDRIQNMAGQSNLLYYWGDSLHVMRQMKTTAITEGRFNLLLGSSSLVMAIADLDSGVFLYDQSRGDPWYRMPGPTSNPIMSLYAGKLYNGGLRDTMLYAANKDGVFIGMFAEQGPAWQKVGTLPSEPLYITGIGSNGGLLAATVKGVYRYGEYATGVGNTSRITEGKSVSGRNKLTMAVTGKPVAGGIGFDLRGRSVVHASAGGLLISTGVKSGQ